MGIWNTLFGGSAPSTPTTTPATPSGPVTAQFLHTMFPALSNPEDFVAPLAETFAKFSINTPLRIAAFVGQTGYESEGYRVLAEDLYYSAEELLRTFPRYFTAAEAAAYAENPEKIANRVYANRMGNGDEASGDGYKFRGRGLIQLTGRDNTTAFGTAMGMDADDASNLLETTRGACLGAGWFWSNNDLNALADASDMTEITRRINGGTLGLDDRIAYWNRAKTLLGV